LWTGLSSERKGRAIKGKIGGKGRTRDGRDVRALRQVRGFEAEAERRGRRTAKVVVFKKMFMSSASVDVNSAFAPMATASERSFLV
jgi:hypothetical protein